LESLLITGHSGFIGSHLVEHLSNDYNIIGIGKTKLKNKKIRQINLDINKITSKIIPKNVSTIIHLAALTDVQYCQKNPQKCFEINIRGTETLLEICRKRNLKFVFLSTSHVFGNPNSIPLDENHSRHPSSIYASSKLCGEILCESFSKSYGLDCSIIRLFSIYGPNSPNHLVTSKIISQILSKKIIKLGNLRPKRDFLYIEDAIEAISMILKNNKGFEAYNVGSGVGSSIKDLLILLKKISGKNFQVIQDKSALRKNDIPKIIADSSKLQNLGWLPKTSLEDGLIQTYTYFQKHIKSE
jgi:nucleoside-diphosphate-sugar epimerase